MIIVDTNVLIELMKDTEEIPEEPLAITTITLYEFLRGARDVDTAASILTENFVVLSETPESIKISAKIWQDLKKGGAIIPDADIVIAGIAIANRLPLWTRNRKHFERFRKYGLILYEEH